MIELKKTSDDSKIHHAKPHKSPEEKVDDLKKALQAIGCNLEETAEGIKVFFSEKK